VNGKEYIAVYFLPVDEMVNVFREPGEEVEESMLVLKVLRSIPLIFDANISSTKEIKDMENMKMDELHGIFTTYEITIEKGK